MTNENAEIVEEFTYDAYGKITSYHQSEVTLNPYCYTGREFDDVDLYYYRFRYYDPTTKRFLSLDPIGFESGDYNHYRYVFSSPVNYTDASGLFAFLIPIVAWIAQYGTVVTAVGVVGARAVQVGSRVAPHVARARQTTTRAVSTAKNAIKTPVSNMDKSKEDVKTEENTKVDGKNGVNIGEGKKPDEDCEKLNKEKEKYQKESSLSVMKGRKKITFGAKSINDLIELGVYKKIKISDIDCEKINIALKGIKKLIEVREKRTKLVNEGRCPPSSTDSDGKWHKKEEIDAKEREQSLENLKEGKKC